MRMATQFGTVCKVNIVSIFTTELPGTQSILSPKGTTFGQSLVAILYCCLNNTMLSIKNIKRKTNHFNTDVIQLLFLLFLVSIPKSFTMLAQKKHRRNFYCKCYFFKKLIFRIVLGIKREILLQMSRQSIVWRKKGSIPRIIYVPAKQGKMVEGEKKPQLHFVVEEEKKKMQFTFLANAPFSRLFFFLFLRHWCTVLFSSKIS